jgi:hypothetical protein
VVQYKIPPKPSLVRFDEAPLPGKRPVTPPGGGKANKGWSDANFSQKLGRRRRRALPKPRVSLEPPHTKFAVIPSRAVTDPHVNTRKPLLLLLAAIGIHAQHPRYLLPKPKKAGDALRQVAQLGRQVPAGIDITGVRSAFGASKISWP